MARADLDKSCNGWQALDATPQEQSDGLMQMGPAPLSAVRTGNHCNYDCEFVIAEVNADVCVWTRGQSGEFELTEVDTDKVTGLY